LKELNKKISIGVLWNFSGLLLSRSATVIFTLILARLLAPEAFGLIAMISIVFELAGVFMQSGLSQALIRTKNIEPIDLNTAFVSNICLSIIAYIFIFSIAPYLAEFYNQPDLISLIRVMGVVIFINASKVVQVAIFSRELNFKVLMRANSLAVLISGICAVISAYYGAGVWSLVVQVVVSSTVLSIVLWSNSLWKPKLEFNYIAFTRLFSFGGHLLAEGLLHVLFQNAYILVIGKLFSAELTGLYYFSKKITELVSQQLTDSVQQVTFPALSKLQDDDSLLLQKYRQVIQVVMFLVVPIMLLLASVASELFDTFFGEKWQPAVKYFQVLCLVGVIFPLNNLNTNLLNIIGRPDLVLKTGIVKKTIFMILLGLSLPYGVFGIVISQLIGSIMALIINSCFISKFINYRYLTQVKDVFKPLIAGIISASMAWVILQEINIHMDLLLLLSLSVGASIYLIISFLIRAEGFVMIWNKLISFATDKKNI
jgi:lipopolysaccharide exporter